MKIDIKSARGVRFKELLHGQAFTFLEGHGDTPYLKVNRSGLSLAASLETGTVYDVGMDTLIIPRKYKVVEDA